MKYTAMMFINMWSVEKSEVLGTKKRIREPG
jgi:hypothetical protein